MFDSVKTHAGNLTVLTSEWRRSCLSLQTHARNTSPNHLGSMSLNFSHQEKSSETVKRKCYFIFNTLYVHDDEFLFNLFSPKNTSCFLSMT